jgi:hypothetical protein
MVLEPAMEEVRVFDPLSSLSSFGISLRLTRRCADGHTRRFQDDKRIKLLTQLQIDNRNEPSVGRWRHERWYSQDTRYRKTYPENWLIFLHEKRRAYSDLTRISVGSAYKTVVIRKPGSINQSTGEYEGDINLHSQSDASGGSINGRVINMSTQVSISVSCNSKALWPIYTRLNSRLSMSAPDNAVLDRLDDADISKNQRQTRSNGKPRRNQRQATMSTGSRFIENTRIRNRLHGITAAGCFIIMLILAGFRSRNLSR